MSETGDGDEDYARLRVRESDREMLKQFKQSQSVKQEAVDEGIIGDTDEQLSYRDLIMLIVPEDADEMSVGEVAWVQMRDEEAKDRVLDLAGDKVSAHQVVNRFVSEFAEKHGIQDD